MHFRLPAAAGRLVTALALTLSAHAALAGPAIQHWIAETGARVYFVPGGTLPMLDVRVDFAAGSSRDPQGMSGLASMARSLLDTGTEGMDEQAIAEARADTGAQFGGGADDDRAGFTVRTLSSAAERDAAITLAARLLARPTYPEAVLTREKARASAGLREALTRPATLADRAFARLVFGDHPYGAQVSFESIEAINRDALLDFHRAHYTARNATITIVGDASRADAERIAVTLTRDLPAGAALPPPPAPTTPPAATERIAHPSSQAHILAGMPGMSRDDPDYFTLLVGNHILGGSGLVSRLSREVRDAHGFAYSVYSYFAPQAVAGPFQIGLQTRGTQADDALKVVREVLTDFITRGPTEEELRAAQANLVNGFGLRLDSNGKILDWVAVVGFYGLPLDWLDTYPQQVSEVTVQGIRDAFARRVQPERLSVVVAGGDGDRAQP
ncbi:MAG: insulinase family protein [Pseudazoarcus pumilus]|nr:insulinase family protein [Pseudazoarcus pumilus]